MPARLTAAIRQRAHLLLWPVLAVVAIGAVIGLIERVAERHLRNDAQASALHWADSVMRAVPELDAVFRGEALSVEARGHLGRLLDNGEVFRFKLIAVDGRTLLLSDAMDRASAALEPQGFSDPAAREVALGGSNHIELRRGDGVARPAYYSEAYVPLKQGARVLGVVELYVDQSEHAGRMDTAFRTIAGAVAALLGALVAVGAWQHLQRQGVLRKADERVHYLAHHDVLTGALNRTSFNDALEQASWRREQGGQGFAVLCIDLDRFKEVNDSLGHPAGDELLRQVTRRLNDAVRSGDLVARLGGDEFAVLQAGVAASEDVSTLAQRIVDALAQPYDLFGHHASGGASVGAAVHGTDGVDTAELLHRADLALYRAKAEGRGRYSFYDPGLDETLQQRRALTHELRAAIAAGALALHFQPLYDADGRTLRGYEALVRWPHPARGLVPPAEFIALAEETGMIDELGRWVLNQACAEAATWPAPLGVAVNLSAAQFRDTASLLRDVDRALATSGLAPQRLELEITESLLMGNTEQALRALNSLHARGVRIAMDDFGTGYSSLAYLWRFPFDKVKIDRSFTHNLGRDDKVDLIVKSIVSLAHSLHISVNAEGVETDTQMAALRAHGCDELQGFLLGRPSPVGQLAHPEPARGPELQRPRHSGFAALSTRPAPL